MSLSKLECDIFMQDTTLFKIMLVFKLKLTCYQIMCNSMSEHVTILMHVFLMLSKGVKRDFGPKCLR